MTGRYYSYGHWTMCKPRAWDVPDFSCYWEVLLSALEVHCILMEVMYMDAFDDVFEAGSAAQEGGGTDDAEFMQSHPRLARLMTAIKLPSGQPRQTSTLIVVFEDGMFKGGLKERDRDVSLWSSSATLAGLLDGLEEALSRKPVDWRRSRGGSRKH